MIDFEFTNQSLEDRKKEAERKEKTLISRIFKMALKKQLLFDEFFS